MTAPLLETKLPWYRHRWPWLLMAGPFAVVVAGAFTAYLAVRSNDGLVDDDYYKQGLAVNRVTARDQQALALGVQADLMRGADGEQLRVLLRGNADFVEPGELRLRISHPTRSGADQSLVLRADGKGLYAGGLASRLSGRWRVVIEDGAGLWRLTGDWNVDRQASLRLPDDHKGR